MTLHLTISDGNPDHALAGLIRRAFDAASGGQSRLDEFALTMAGMSGRKYRSFINLLIASLPDARYLEVGTWAGSTLCAAIQGNAVEALAIDDWSQFGGPASLFLTNLARCRGPGARVSFLERDFRAVDYAAIGRYNVFLFDGPHEQQDQVDALTLPLPALDQDFALIVDDWNYPPVRLGTMQAIQALGLRVDLAIEVRTTLDNSIPDAVCENSDWHNGYFIAAIRKP